MTVRSTLTAVLVGALLLQTAVLAGVTQPPTTAAGLATTQEDADFEPNDDAEAATEIEAPFRGEGFQTSSEDPDVYAVTLERGDRLNASIGFDHTDGDTDLFVYDSQQRRIASSLSATDNETVSVQVRESGTYYVLVTGRTEAATNYSMAVSRTQQPIESNDELEPNDGFESATAVTAPYQRDDLRIVSADRDRYAVESDGQLALTATITHNASGNLGLRLYGPDQEQITAGRSLAANETLSASLPERGTYYVAVHNEIDRTTSYSLSIETQVQAEPTTPETETTAATDPEPTTTTGPTATQTSADGDGFTLLTAVLALCTLTVLRLVVHLRRGG